MHFFSIRLCVYLETKRISSESKDTPVDKETVYRNSLQKQFKAYTRGHGNLGGWELTNRCLQIAFVNIAYYEKATLCLRASIAQGKKKTHAGAKTEMQKMYTKQKKKQMYIINQKKRAKHDGFCLPYKGQIPKFRILENQEISEKSQNFIELLPISQSSSRNKFFSLLVKVSRKTETELLPQCNISHENQSQSQIFCE